jgi:uncharacterized protein (TIGR00730 family)
MPFLPSIGSEFDLIAETRLGAERPWAVCVYCAAHEDIGPEYLALAEAVGLGVAERGWTLVSGGGRCAMMGSVAKAARAGGAHTVGVMPRSLVDREWADLDSDELLITNTMRERKALMDASSDAFITLPGGLGTCEELFETWCSRTLDLHTKPVVLLDPAGHYTGLLAWVQGLVASGFAKPSALDRIIVAEDVPSALDACAGAQGTIPVPKAPVDALADVPPTTPAEIPA